MSTANQENEQQPTERDENEMEIMLVDEESYVRRAETVSGGFDDSDLFSMSESVTA